VLAHRPSRALVLHQQRHRLSGEIARRSRVGGVRQTVVSVVTTSGSGRLDEADFARHIELGHENVRIMELAANHCRHMRCVESGGRGMLEEMSGLPLNSRRVECPVAIGNFSGMRLDHLRNVRILRRALRRLGYAGPDGATSEPRDRGSSPAASGRRGVGRRPRGAARGARRPLRRTCGPSAQPARAPGRRSSTARAGTRSDHAYPSITAGQRPWPEFWHPASSCKSIWSPDGSRCEGQP